ncbi:MAG: hypothetical protein ABS49_06470 [Erythrobacter sp. SCN 62-14]|nr:MAG: hypothetical protein ABS49_06470 [Erythrobacter sp. SCN 62-14]
MAVGLAMGGTALLLASGAAAQGLTPLSPAEVSTLPPEYRTAPVLADRTETSIGADGVETITRTRYIAAPAASMAPAPLPAPVAYPGAQPTMMPMQTMTYGMQPVVFDRAQWLDECRRRTAGRNRNDTGTIIGALLGAIGGGVAGNLLAGAGDKLLGTAVGAVGGGVSGGLIGSLFNGRKRNRYDCEAALDSYLSQPAPVQRIASREIPMAYAAPAYAMPVMMQPTYAYAMPMQNVVVPVQYEQPQQVVVRETVREEVVPGAARMIPAPRPTKLIKAER